MTTTIAMSEDQERAMKEITAWLDQDGKQQLTLGGYAGTGKTTIIRELIDVLNERDTDWIVLTPTGKAAHVLRGKDVQAQTIHSHLYICKYDGVEGKPVFTRRPKWEIERDIIIVDESSMVSADLFNDLILAAPKILWVGDHGQLEPVGQNCGLMLNPEVRLEEIHRQAAQSPIVRYSEYVRKGGVFHRNHEENGISGDRLILAPDELDWLDPDQLENTVHLCAFHKTRVGINEEFRRMLKRKKDLEEGEPVICLRNNRDYGVFNGMTGVVTKIRSRFGKKMYVDIMTDDDVEHADVPIMKEQFGQPNNGPTKRVPNEITVWDYGYCITCHKAQGSEWDRVVVHEPPGAPDNWNMPRWRYTAATRASKDLVYLFA